MKVLLVYPQYPDTFWSFKHALNFVSKKAAFPPLGLLTVASMLPKKWEKRLIDTNVTILRDEDIIWADMVFLSAMIVQKTSAQEIISRCKTMGKTIVAGGPAFTINPKKFYGVDHFVLNEAEVTLPRFLKDLKTKRTQSIYTSKIRPDISKTPLPLWSLINFRDYVNMAVQYSRGCPFNCEFCDIVVMNGRIPRTKTPRQFVGELQSLHDAGWRRSVFIVDDNFIGNKINVKKMLLKLIDWQKTHNYPYTLLTEASTNLASDEELMQLMSLANFNKVFLGIETPHIDSLKECGKFQNVACDLKEAVKTIHRHGMQVMAGFIVGFDNDTDSIFETQIKFIQKIGVTTAMVGLLNAVPQTRLWYRLKAEKRLLGDPTGENTDGSLNFIPKMGRKKLLKGYRQVLSTIYTPKYYYQRIETFIGQYRPTAKGKFSKEIFRPFFKSMWDIGILSEARFYYWKLLIKTFFTKIQAFPVAIELTIYQVHFEKVAKKALQNPNP